MTIVELILKAEKLKGVKRTGWVRKGIPEAESVADHSFGVAILALLLSLPPEIDRDALIKMALLHDLGESVIGDIVCEDGNTVDVPKMQFRWPCRYFLPNFTRAQIGRASCRERV